MTTLEAASAEKMVATQKAYYGDLLGWTCAGGLLRCCVCPAKGDTPGADDVTVLTVEQWASESAYEDFRASKLWRAPADRPGLVALVGDASRDIMELKFSGAVAHFCK